MGLFGKKKAPRIEESEPMRSYANIQEEGYIDEESLNKPKIKPKSVINRISDAVEDIGDNLNTAVSGDQEEDEEQQLRNRIAEIDRQRKEMESEIQERKKAQQEAQRPKPQIQQVPQIAQENLIAALQQLDSRIANIEAKLFRAGF